MFPIKDFISRFEEILARLDEVAEERGDETLEDMNAELEDAIMLLSELRQEDEAWREDMEDTLEMIREMASDYKESAVHVPALAEPARQLEMLATIALANLGKN